MEWLLPLFMALWPIQIFELPWYELRLAMQREACAEAEAITRRAPCLRPEDCGALQEWRQLMGTPGLELLEPELAEAWAFRPGAQGTWGVPEGGPRTRRPRDRVFVCPAGAGRR